LWFLFLDIFLFKCIVLKPGPAQRVNTGPGWPGAGTGLGWWKNRSGNWSGKTRSTRESTRDPVEPGKPGWFIYIKRYRFSFFTIKYQPICNINTES
jgi:hypothetical protein